MGGRRSRRPSSSADGVASRPGDGVGGLDIIHVGTGSTFVSGDVENVGSPVAGSPASQYRGGNDEILGHVTERGQGVIGDASRVYGGSRLTGGNDSILVQSNDATTYVSGDAGDAVGEVVGGNDYITVGWDFRGEIAGDVSEAHPREPRRGRRRHGYSAATSGTGSPATSTSCGADG